jgi:hypothetical protein
MSTKNQVSGVPRKDPILPKVALILDGVERHLVFDFNAIVQADNETGFNLLQAAVSDITATTLRGLLWASLLKENPDLTIGEVGSWITMHNAFHIRQAITTAWFGSIAEAEESASDEGKQIAELKPLSISDYWSRARYDLGLTEAEFYSFTPRQFSLLYARHRESLAHAEMVSAHTTAAVKNYSFNPPEKYVSPLDYMPNHREHSSGEAEHVVSEEVLEAQAAYQQRALQLSVELKAQANRN